MSVIIRGMKMPKGCAFCKIPMRNGKKMNCPLVRCEWDFRDPMSADHRLEGCPLAELPPHGRLIDGDVAEVIVTDTKDEVGDFLDGILYAADWIANQPTVIEAEEVSE